MVYDSLKTVTQESKNIFFKDVGQHQKVEKRNKTGDE